VVAKDRSYDESMFKRLFKHPEIERDRCALKLRVQYRMHPEILKFPNRYFYEKILKMVRVETD